MKGFSESVGWSLTRVVATMVFATGFSGRRQKRFASPLFLTGDATLTRYLYTGRDFDFKTGLQYNRARWYDPHTGRFTTQDPSGFAAGDSNLYRYVGNSPTNHTDPTGRNWLTDWWNGWWPTGADAALEACKAPVPVGTGLSAAECAVEATKVAQVKKAQVRWQALIGQPGEKQAWIEFRRLQDLLYKDLLKNK